MHSLHTEVSRLLKTCLAQWLSYSDVYSHSLRPAGKRRELNSLKMSLLKACNRILAHVEQIYALHGLHVGFAKKKSAELNGLLTGHGLRGTLGEKDPHAVYMIFLLVASFTDGGIGYEASFDVT